MKRVLAVGAHPDDIEFFMSGTLLQLQAVGYDLHYFNLANGCCGTTEYDRPTISKIRRAEAIAAAELIGAVYHESICDDLAIFYDQPTLAKVASVVRSVQPSIILTHSPVDYMEDHTNTCRLAVTAAFSRGMPNFPVDPPCEPMSADITVYHAQPYSHRDPLRQAVVPDLFVDVSGLVERKVEMLSKHESQKRWLDESQGHDSYLETLRELDAECGRLSGLFRYAEGWRRHLHLGFSAADADPLKDALAGKVLVA